VDTRYATLGVIEGIILALGLGAKILLVPGQATAGNVILNAGILAAVIDLITSFFTELYQEREHLLTVERQMVISQRGWLLRTSLYQHALRRVAERSATYAIAAFVGASIPLLPIFILPHLLLLGLLLPLGLLFILGFFLGKSVAGSPLVWGAGMVAAGLFVTFVGLVFPV
jgi:predicted membrane protein (TIGR00267 family)